MPPSCSLFNLSPRFLRFLCLHPIALGDSAADFHGREAIQQLSERYRAHTTAAPAGEKAPPTTYNPEEDWEELALLNAGKKDPLACGRPKDDDQAEYDSEEEEEDPLIGRWVEINYLEDELDRKYNYMRGLAVKVNKKLKEHTKRVYTVKFFGGTTFSTISAHLRLLDEEEIIVELERDEQNAQRMLEEQEQEARERELAKDEEVERNLREGMKRMKAQEKERLAREKKEAKEKEAEEHRLWREKCEKEQLAEEEQQVLTYAYSLVGRTVELKGLEGFDAALNGMQGVVAHVRAAGSVVGVKLPSGQLFYAAKANGNKHFVL